MPDLVKTEEVKIETTEVDVSKYTKSDWANLAKTDPGKFAELTQARMDMIFRESRETKEKLSAAEIREKNLLAEIERFKTPPVVEPKEGEPVTYGNGVYPKTEEEWNDLFLERPTFATDLRNEFLTKRHVVQTDFEEKRARARKLVQEQHQDMYLPELDETGQPKKDAQGKVLLKIDPNMGEPIFNPESEKGKLWVSIWNEDPDGWSKLKNAPQLMMAEMERRLRVKGASMVNGQKDSNEIDQSGLAPQGVVPPKSSSLRFSSEDEKAHALRQVNRGVYRSLEEYVQHRDTEQMGYAKPNSRPDFTKR